MARTWVPPIVTGAEAGRRVSTGHQGGGYDVIQRWNPDGLMIDLDWSLQAAPPAEPSASP